MFHTTARRLDEPYKLYGFTLGQCLLLVFGGGGVITSLILLDVGIQLGGFLGTLVIGIPALYWLLGESDRIDPGELVRDVLRHLLAPARYRPGKPEPETDALHAARDGAASGDRRRS